MRVPYQNEEQSSQADAPVASTIATSESHSQEGAGASKRQEDSSTSSRPGKRFHRPDPQAPQPRHRWTEADTIATLTITAIALLMRLFQLARHTSGGTPVFDEKHYVPQAFDMVDSAINPVLGGMELNPGYGLVVHPPLAKQILAIGIEIFGYNPWGWRIMTALFGTGVVVLIMAITRQLTRSTTAATFAGILALCDGVLLVTSRFGMLDIFQVFFIVAATWMLVRDHLQAEERMYRAWKDGLIDSCRALGPRMGFRWWRFGAGVMLGCAVSVKWSGLYYMAFFGVLIVLLDVARRYRYQIRHPFRGTLLYDCFAAFASIVLLPIALYAWSWRAWFATENAVYRHSATNGDIPADSFLHKLPDALAGWVYYHQRVLNFHASLTTSSGHSHPWDSKPWSWLVASRPVLYLSANDIQCGEKTCRQAIYLFGTPAIWWLTVPVLLWALWAMVVRRQFMYLFPWVLFMAGFLPWLANMDRQMYFFYAAALVPATIVLLAMTLYDISRMRTPVQAVWLRSLFPWLGRGVLTWQWVGVAVYLALVIVCFGYFSPLLYGFQISNEHFDHLMWMSSWK